MKLLKLLIATAVILLTINSCKNEKVSPETQNINSNEKTRSFSQKNGDRQFTIVTQECVHKNKKMNVYCILLFSEKKSSKNSDIIGEVTGFMVYGKKSKLDAICNAFESKLKTISDLKLDQIELEIKNAANGLSTDFKVEALDEYNIKILLGINGLNDYHNQHGYKMDGGSSTLFAEISGIAHTSIGIMQTTDNSGKFTNITEIATKGNLSSITENNQGLNLIINFTNSLDNINNGLLLNYNIHENKSIANWLNTESSNTQNNIGTDIKDENKILLGMNLANGLFNAEFKHLKNGFEIAEDGEKSIYRVFFSYQRILELKTAMNGYYFNTLTQNHQHPAKMLYKGASDVTQN